MKVLAARALSALAQSNHANQAALADEGAIELITELAQQLVPQVLAQHASTAAIAATAATVATAAATTAAATAAIAVPGGYMNGGTGVSSTTSSYVPSLTHSILPTPPHSSSHPAASVAFVPPSPTPVHTLHGSRSSPAAVLEALLSLASALIEFNPANQQAACESGLLTLLITLLRHEVTTSHSSASELTVSAPAQAYTTGNGSGAVQDSAVWVQALLAPLGSQGSHLPDCLSLTPAPSTASTKPGEGQGQGQGQSQGQGQGRVPVAVLRASCRTLALLAQDCDEAVSRLVGGGVAAHDVRPVLWRLLLSTPATHSTQLTHPTPAETLGVGLSASSRAANADTPDASAAGASAGASPAAGATWPSAADAAALLTPQGVDAAAALHVVRTLEYVTLRRGAEGGEEQAASRAAVAALLHACGAPPPAAAAAVAAPSAATSVAPASSMAAVAPVSGWDYPQLLPGAGHGAVVADRVAVGVWGVAATAAGVAATTATPAAAAAASAAMPASAVKEAVELLQQVLLACARALGKGLLPATAAAASATSKPVRTASAIIPGASGGALATLTTAASAQRRLSGSALGTTTPATTAATVATAGLAALGRSSAGASPGQPTALPHQQTPSFSTGLPSLLSPIPASFSAPLPADSGRSHFDSFPSGAGAQGQDHAGTLSTHLAAPLASAEYPPGSAKTGATPTAPRVLPPTQQVSWQQARVLVSQAGPPPTGGAGLAGAAGGGSAVLQATPLRWQDVVGRGASAFAAVAAVASEGAWKPVKLQVRHGALTTR